MVKIGDRFGRLIVQGMFIEHNRQKAKVKCDCGVVKEIRADSLSSGAVLSCGCFGREQRLKGCTKHGQCRRKGRSPLYQIWLSMHNRCRDSSRQYYGAVGVKVCRNWQHFESFAAWAKGHGYRDGLMIDRVHTNQGYAPSNCRFVNRFEQNQHLTKRCTNRSGFIGVDWSRGQWRVRAQVYNRLKWLGYFDDAYSAAWVRDKYVCQYASRFVTLNGLKDRRIRKKPVAIERRGTFDWSVCNEVSQCF